MTDIPRIKGNIEKMIAQGAPEADIDAYLSGEGVTVAQLKGQKPESTAGDLMKSFDSGVAGGVAILGGLPGDVAELGAKGIGAAANFIERKQGKPESTGWTVKNTPLLRDLPTRESMQAEIQKSFYNGEKPYEPQSKGGQVVKAIGEFAPSVAAGPGGLVAKTLMATGGGAGQVYGGDAAANVLGEGARPYGEFVGGMAGSIAPHAAGRLITPNPVRPSRQRLIDTLENEGVTSLTAGQRTGSKRIQYLEDGLGNAPLSGGRADRITREGQEQFTAAAMRRAGAGPDATPEVMRANRDRLGQNFEDISSRNNLAPDQQFVTDMVRTARDYVDTVLPAQRPQGKQNVEGIMNDIVTAIQQNGGVMPGELYQATRSRFTKMAESLRQSDPQLADAIRGIRNALDDAFARSVSPEDAALLAQTRREYGAQKTLEKVASRAGEATAEGQIVPGNLRNAVSTGNNAGQYSRGEGAFGELARAGAGVMAPLPNSGTAQRSNALQLLNQATLGIPAAMAGRALMSRPVQGYLGNQLLARQLENLPAARQALIRALMAQDRTPLLQGPSN